MIYLTIIVSTKSLGNEVSSEAGQWPLFPAIYYSFQKS